MNSKNQSIQSLMDEVNRIDDQDPELETKLQLIAQRVTEEQQRTKGHVSADNAPIDPADVFACEGCQ